MSTNIKWMDFNKQMSVDKRKSIMRCWRPQHYKAPMNSTAMADNNMTLEAMALQSTRELHSDGRWQCNIKGHDTAIRGTPKVVTRSATSAITHGNVAKAKLYVYIILFIFLLLLTCLLSPRRSLALLKWRRL